MHCSVLASNKSAAVTLQKRVLTLVMIGTNAIVVERMDRMEVFARAGSISDQPVRDQRPGDCYGIYVTEISGALSEFWPVLSRVFISEFKAVHISVFEQRGVLIGMTRPCLQVEMGIVNSQNVELRFKLDEF